MLLLFLGVLTLGVGPVLYHLARGRPSGLALLDGFIVVAISGLVVLRVIPEAINVGGWWALAFGVLGLLGPSLLERWRRGAERSTHRTALGLALVGLAFHTVFDGAALNMGSADGHGHGHGHTDLLPLAVILHRLPVGITVWWLMRPAGRLLSTLTLGGLAVTTVLGFMFGPQLLLDVHPLAVAWFEALVGGTLLHVVLHRPAPRSPGLGRWDEGIGAFVGVILLVVLLGHEGGPTGEASRTVGSTFLALALTSAGPLLLAYVLAGLFAGLLPASAVRWMGRGGPFRQAVRGTLIGLPFPVCSCGVVPLYRGFVRRGVPASAGLAFLIATPELGLDAVLLSLPLLGTPMTLVRLAGAAVVALAVGWFIGRRTPRVVHDEGEEEAIGSDAGLADRLRVSARTGLGEMVDHTAAWILLGLAVAALAAPLLDQPWVREIPRGWDVLAFAALGMPIYVCASGATPLVAVLLVSGVSPGAALAFLLTGPATNVTTYGVLASLHGAAMARSFILVMIVVAVGLGLVVNAVLPTLTPPGAIVDPEHASPFQWACLVGLALLYAWSLLRLGARGFLLENLQLDRPSAAPHIH